MSAIRPFEIVEGQKLLLSGTIHNVLRIKGAQITLENDDRVLNLSHAEVMRLYRQGVIEPVKRKKTPVSLIMKLRPEQREQMRIREEIVKEIHKQGPNAPTAERSILAAYDVVRKQHRGENIEHHFRHHGTAAKWVKKYRLYDEDPYMLIDNPNQTQGKGKRPPVEVDELMFKVLCDYYLSKSWSIPKTYEKFKELMAEELPQYKVPGMSTLYNRKDELDPDFVIYHRKGPHAHSQATRQALKTYQICAPYSRWEMDGKVVQVGILHPETYEYLGIATIMFVIDCFSRVIPGYAIKISKTHGEPVELAVACFKNAVMPNEDGTGYGGLPDLLVADAGASLKSVPFKHFLMLTGVDSCTTVPKKPQKKPFIERFNLTFEQECLRGMPGFQGTLKLKERFVVQDNVEKAATLTSKEFIATVDRFIESYNNTRHSSLGTSSPNQVWQHYVYPGSGLMRMPGDDTDPKENSLELFMRFSGRCQVGTLQDIKGVVAENRYYNSRELRKKFKRFIGKKKSLFIYYDHLDVSSVVVVAPDTNEICIVPSTAPFVTSGMSKAEYEARKDAPYANISAAEERLWQSAQDIFDGALARRASLELAKKRAEAEKRKEQRENNPHYKGIDIDNGNSLNKAIDHLMEANAPIDSEIIEAEAFEENAENTETFEGVEYSDDNTLDALDSKATVGGTRGEF